MSVVIGVDAQQNYHSPKFSPSLAFTLFPPIHPGVRCDASMQDEREVAHTSEVVGREGQYKFATLFRNKIPN